MSGPRRHRRVLATALAAAACGWAAWLAGCTNEPFDPATLPNQPPVASVYVSPAPGGELNPTSYYERTFSWSGTDEDGFVTEFHVSIDVGDVEGDWTVTSRTDTTMTFTTDDEGEALALLKVACRDDRGAMSDTVASRIPLRNFPPVINFATDYDTTFWSFGAANFRLFAVDLDGNVTMDDSVVYYLDTADTTLAPLPEGEPDADPNLRPVIKAIDDPATGHFDIDLTEITERGQRVLNVRVGDEADATGAFVWEWEARPILSNVLLMDDFPGDIDVPFYHGAMDSIYGPGGWSMCDLTEGLPDRMWVFMSWLREFDAVFWYTTITTSANLGQAAALLHEYLSVPTAEDPDGGRLLLISKGLIGGTGSLPPTFVQETLGVSRTPSQPTFYIPADKLCLATPPGRLPDLHFLHGYSAGVGLTPTDDDTEAIYQMEYYLFWSPTRRPPYEPIVGVRRPHSNTGEPARAVTVTLQFEAMNPADGLGAVRGMLENELGVVLP